MSVFDETNRFEAKQKPAPPDRARLTRSKVVLYSGGNKICEDGNDVCEIVSASIWRLHPAAVG